MCLSDTLECACSFSTTAMVVPWPCSHACCFTVVLLPLQPPFAHPDTSPQTRPGDSLPPQMPPTPHRPWDAPRVRDAENAQLIAPVDLNIPCPKHDK